MEILKHITSNKRKPEKHEPAYSAKEVAPLFGFKNVHGLHSSVKSGCFPAPDLQTLGTKNNVKNLWRKSTLDKEMKRRTENDKAETTE